MKRSMLRDTNERREELVRILMMNDKCTMEYLANSLDVSVRTIKRDLDYLCTVKPIQIDVGRAGGVYITNRKAMNLPIMRSDEIELLARIVSETVRTGVCELDDDQVGLLKEMIDVYSAEKHKKTK